MKRVAVFLFLICSINFGQVYMSIHNKDGTKQSFPIDEIRKLTFTGLLGVNEGKLITNTLKSFTLLQNYPNPFNPTTTIEYQIQTPGNVKVAVFNITGEHVKTLESKSKKSGSYKLIWNGKNDFDTPVASGVYFVKVEHNKKFLTKKIMLLK